MGIQDICLSVTRPLRRDNGSFCRSIDVFRPIKRQPDLAHFGLGFSQGVMSKVFARTEKTQTAPPGMVLYMNFQIWYHCYSLNYGTRLEMQAILRFFWDSRRHRIVDIYVIFE
jgi:hypothetical protein